MGEKRGLRKRSTRVGEDTEFYCKNMATEYLEIEVENGEGTRDLNIWVDG